MAEATSVSPLALANGRTGDEIVKLYETLGEQVFKGQLLG